MNSTGDTGSQQNKQGGAAQSVPTTLVKSPILPKQVVLPSKLKQPSGKHASLTTVVPAALSVQAKNPKVANIENSTSLPKSRANPVVSTPSSSTRTRLVNVIQADTLGRQKPTTPPRLPVLSPPTLTESTSRVGALRMEIRDKRKEKLQARKEQDANVSSLIHQSMQYIMERSIDESEGDRSIGRRKSMDGNETSAPKRTQKHEEALSNQINDTLDDIENQLLMQLTSFRDLSKKESVDLTASNPTPTNTATTDPNPARRVSQEMYFNPSFYTQRRQSSRSRPEPKQWDVESDIKAHLERSLQISPMRVSQDTTARSSVLDPSFSSTSLPNNTQLIDELQVSSLTASFASSTSSNVSSRSSSISVSASTVSSTSEQDQSQHPEEEKSLLSHVQCFSLTSAEPQYPNRLFSSITHVHQDGIPHSEVFSPVTSDLEEAQMPLADSELKNKLLLLRKRIARNQEPSHPIDRRAELEAEEGKQTEEEQIIPVPLADTNDQSVSTGDLMTLSASSLPSHSLSDSVAAPVPAQGPIPPSIPPASATDSTSEPNAESAPRLRGVEGRIESLRHRLQLAKQSAESNQRRRLSALSLHSDPHPLFSPLVTTAQKLATAESLRDETAPLRKQIEQGLSVPGEVNPQRNIEEHNVFGQVSISEGSAEEVSTPIAHEVEDNEGEMRADTGTDFVDEQLQISKEMTTQNVAEYGEVVSDTDAANADQSSTHASAKQDRLVLSQGSNTDQETAPVVPSTEIDPSTAHILRQAASDPVSRKMTFDDVSFDTPLPEIASHSAGVATVPSQISHETIGIHAPGERATASPAITTSGHSLLQVRPGYQSIDMGRLIHNRRGTSEELLCLLQTSFDPKSLELQYAGHISSTANLVTSHIHALLSPSGNVSSPSLRVSQTQPRPCSGDDAELYSVQVPFRYIGSLSADMSLRFSNSQMTLFSAPEHMLESREEHSASRTSNAPFSSRSVTTSSLSSVFQLSPSSFLNIHPFHIGHFDVSFDPRGLFVDSRLHAAINSAAKAFIASNSDSVGSAAISPDSSTPMKQKQSNKLFARIQSDVEVLLAYSEPRTGSDQSFSSSINSSLPSFTLQLHVSAVVGVEIPSVRAIIETEQQANTTEEMESVEEETAVEKQNVFENDDGGDTKQSQASNAEADLSVKPISPLTHDQIKSEQIGKSKPTSEVPVASPPLHNVSEPRNGPALILPRETLRNMQPESTETTSLPSAPVVVRTSTPDSAAHAISSTLHRTLESHEPVPDLRRLSLRERSLSRGTSPAPLAAPPTRPTPTPDAATFLHATRSNPAPPVPLHPNTHAHTPAPHAGASNPSLGLSTQLPSLSSPPALSSSSASSPAQPSASGNLIPVPASATADSRRSSVHSVHSAFTDTSSPKAGTPAPPLPTATRSLSQSSTGGRVVEKSGGVQRIQRFERTASDAHMDVVPRTNSVPQPVQQTLSPPMSAPQTTMASRNATPPQVSPLVPNQLHSTAHSRTPSIVSESSFPGDEKVVTKQGFVVKPDKPTLDTQKNQREKEKAAFEAYIRETLSMLEQKRRSMKFFEIDALAPPPSSAPAPPYPRKTKEPKTTASEAFTPVFTSTDLPPVPRSPQDIPAQLQPVLPRLGSRGNSPSSASQAAFSTSPLTSVRSDVSFPPVENVSLDVERRARPFIPIEVLLQQQEASSGEHLPPFPTSDRRNSTNFSTHSPNGGADETITVRNRVLPESWKIVEVTVDADSSAFLQKETETLSGMSQYSLSDIQHLRGTASLPPMKEEEDSMLVGLHPDHSVNESYVMPHMRSESPVERNFALSPYEDEKEEESYKREQQPMEGDYAQHEETVNDAIEKLEDEDDYSTIPAERTRRESVPVRDELISQTENKLQQIMDRLYMGRVSKLRQNVLSPSLLESSHKDTQLESINMTLTSEYSEYSEAPHSLQQQHSIVPFAADNLGSIVAPEGAFSGQYAFPDTTLLSELSYMDSEEYTTSLVHSRMPLSTDTSKQTRASDNDETLESTSNPQPLIATVQDLQDMAPGAEALLSRSAIIRSRIALLSKELGPASRPTTTVAKRVPASATSEPTANKVPGQEVGLRAKKAGARRVSVEMERQRGETASSAERKDASPQKSILRKHTGTGGGRIQRQEQSHHGSESLATSATALRSTRNTKPIEIVRDQETSTDSIINGTGDEESPVLATKDIRSLVQSLRSGRSRDGIPEPARLPSPEFDDASSASGSSEREEVEAETSLELVAVRKPRHSRGNKRVDGSRPKNRKETRESAQNKLREREKLLLTKKRIYEHNERLSSTKKRRMSNNSYSSASSAASSDASYNELAVVSRVTRNTSRKAQEWRLASSPDSSDLAVSPLSSDDDAMSASSSSSIATSSTASESSDAGRWVVVFSAGETQSKQVFKPKRRDEKSKKERKKGRAKSFSKTVVDASKKKKYAIMDETRDSMNETDMIQKETSPEPAFLEHLSRLHSPSGNRSPTGKEITTKVKKSSRLASAQRILISPQPSAAKGPIRSIQDVRDRRNHSSVSIDTQSHEKSTTSATHGQRSRTSTVETVTSSATQPNESSNTKVTFHAFIQSLLASSSTSPADKPSSTAITANSGTAPNRNTREMLASPPSPLLAAATVPSITDSPTTQPAPPTPKTPRTPHTPRTRTRNHVKEEFTPCMRNGAEERRRARREWLERETRAEHQKQTQKDSQSRSHTAPHSTFNGVPGSADRNTAIATTPSTLKNSKDPKYTKNAEILARRKKALSVVSPEERQRAREAGLKYREQAKERRKEILRHIAEQARRLKQHGGNHRSIGEGPGTIEIVLNSPDASILAHETSSFWDTSVLRTLSIEDESMLQEDRDMETVGERMDESQLDDNMEVEIYMTSPKNAKAGREARSLSSPPQIADRDTDETTARERSKGTRWDESFLQALAFASRPSAHPTTATNPPIAATPSTPSPIRLRSDILLATVLASPSMPSASPLSSIHDASTTATSIFPEDLSAEEASVLLLAGVTAAMRNLQQHLPQNPTPIKQASPGIALAPVPHSAVYPVTHLPLPTRLEFDAEVRNPVLSAHVDRTVISSPDRTELSAVSFEEEARADDAVGEPKGPDLEVELSGLEESTSPRTEMEADSTVGELTGQEQQGAGLAAANGSVLSMQPSGEYSYLHPVALAFDQSLHSIDAELPEELYEESMEAENIASHELSDAVEDEGEDEVAAVEPTTTKSLPELEELEEIEEDKKEEEDIDASAEELFGVESEDVNEVAPTEVEDEPSKGVEEIISQSISQVHAAIGPEAIEYPEQESKLRASDDAPLTRQLMSEASLASAHEEDQKDPEAHTDSHEVFYEQSINTASVAHQPATESIAPATPSTPIPPTPLTPIANTSSASLHTSSLSSLSYTPVTPSSLLPRSPSAPTQAAAPPLVFPRPSAATATATATTATQSHLPCYFLSLPAPAVPRGLRSLLASPQKSAPSPSSSSCASISRGHHVAALPVQNKSACPLHLQFLSTHTAPLPAISVAAWLYRLPQNSDMNKRSKSKGKSTQMNARASNIGDTSLPLLCALLPGHASTSECTIEVKPHGTAQVLFAWNLPPFESVQPQSPSTSQLFSLSPTPKKRTSQSIPPSASAEPSFTPLRPVFPLEGWAYDPKSLTLHTSFLVNAQVTCTSGGANASVNDDAQFERHAIRFSVHQDAWTLHHYYYDPMLHCLVPLELGSWMDASLIRPDTQLGTSAEVEENTTKETTVAPGAHSTVSIHTPSGISSARKKKKAWMQDHQLVLSPVTPLTPFPRHRTAADADAEAPLQVSPPTPFPSLLSHPSPPVQSVSPSSSDSDGSLQHEEGDVGESADLGAFVDAESDPTVGSYPTSPILPGSNASPTSSPIGSAATATNTANANATTNPSQGSYQVYISGLGVIDGHLIRARDTAGTGGGNGGGSVNSTMLNTPDTTLSQSCIVPLAHELFPSLRTLLPTSATGALREEEPTAEGGNINELQSQVMVSRETAMERACNTTPPTTASAPTDAYAQSTTAQKADSNPPSRSQSASSTGFVPRLRTTPLPTAFPLPPPLQVWKQRRLSVSSASSVASDGSVSSASSTQKDLPLQQNGTIARNTLAEESIASIAKNSNGTRGSKEQEQSDDSNIAHKSQPVNTSSTSKKDNLKVTHSPAASKISREDESTTFVTAASEISSRLHLSNLTSSSVNTTQHKEDSLLGDKSSLQDQTILEDCGMSSTYFSNESESTPEGETGNKLIVLSEDAIAMRTLSFSPPPEIPSLFSPRQKSLYTRVKKENNEK